MMTPCINNRIRSVRKLCRLDSGFMGIYLVNYFNGKNNLKS